MNPYRCKDRIVRIVCRLRLYASKITHTKSMFATEVSGEHVTIKVAEHEVVSDVDKSLPYDEKDTPESSEVTWERTDAGTRSGQIE